jgi:aspartokinase
VQKRNINQEVWKVLQSDLAVQKDLSRNILNVRALAKYVIKKYHLPASLDSVISSIRRFQGTDNFEEEESVLLNIFRDSIVSTKNNIACITLNLRPKELFGKICESNGPLVPFKLTSGSEELRIIVEQPHLEKVKALFDKKDVARVEKDLSELSVIVSEEASHTKGVIARLMSELSLANINVHELIITTPEFLIYVKEKDIVKAHEAIIKLSEGRRN